MRGHQLNERYYLLASLEDTLAPVDPLLPQKTILRAPTKIPLKQVKILHRPPQTTWTRDNALKANQLLDGLASYLRTKDPK